jgi:deaminated glutathione amidase
MQRMKVAAVQMVSTPDVDRNLHAAARLVAQAAQAGAVLVSLPEYFCLLGRRDTDKLAIAEHAGTGPIQQFLAQTARRHGIWLVGGTLPLRAGQVAGAGDVQRVLNRCCVFAPDGSQAAHYDKLHLFAFDNGRESYDEGRTLQAGSQPVALDTVAWPGGSGGESHGDGDEVDGDVGSGNGNGNGSGSGSGSGSGKGKGKGKGQGNDGNGNGSRTDIGIASKLRVGLSVCYDLRFPELYRALMQPPCDLLCVPSAFTATTGRAHWELLLRARAVENQCYVLAAAQGGTHENGRRTWGHSMVVDPWGEVLAVCDDGEGVALADIDRARINQVRSQLPALAHRKL